ncbi:MAG: hypothetical protein ACP5NS_04975 [Candidatus Pacearchaeota archaeon]
MDIKELITELELHKEYLDDKAREFVESVAEQYYEKGTVTDKQKEWLEIYYKQLKKELDDVDESWLMNDFD